MKSWQISRGSFKHHSVRTLTEIERHHALMFLPAEEDCALRSLVKGEIQDRNDKLGEPEDNSENGDEEDSGET